LPHWGSLGEFAYRVLEPGGYFFSFFGKLFLPEVIESLSRGLKYFGLIIIPFDGGPALLRGRAILSGFNTIIGFYKPTLDGKLKQTELVYDVLKATKEKDFHKWQQPEYPFGYLIRKLTQPGDQVLDPCGGAGTTVVACKKLKRKCTAIELEEETVELIKGRLVDLQDKAEKYENKNLTPRGAMLKAFEEYKTPMPGQAPVQMPEPEKE
jgi:hypothetical protein